MLKPEDDIPLLTVAEAAAVMRRDPRTISRWIATGGLQFIPAHPEKLIRLDHLQAKAMERAKKRRGHVKRKYSGEA